MSISTKAMERRLDLSKVGTTKGWRTTVVILLLVPSLLEDAYLYFGHVLWRGGLLVQFPRLTFIACLAMYLAGGLGLWEIRKLFSNNGLAKVSRYVPWLIVGSIVIWGNLDSFGFPSLYYHFYYPTPNVWVDRLGK
jgi:hypothetical protein